MTPMNHIALRSTCLKNSLASCGRPMHLNPHSKREAISQQVRSTCSETNWLLRTRSAPESPFKTGSYSLTSAKYLFGNNLAFCGRAMHLIPHSGREVVPQQVQTVEWWDSALIPPAPSLKPKRKLNQKNHQKNNCRNNNYRNRFRDRPPVVADRRPGEMGRPKGIKNREHAQERVGNLCNSLGWWYSS